jgi:hypothetical protein
MDDGEGFARAVASAEEADAGFTVMKGELDGMKLQLLEALLIL